MRSGFGLLAAVFVLAFHAAPVRAAVVEVNIESPTHAPIGQDQVVYADVFLRDVDNTDERLNAYTVAVNGPSFSASGVRFLPPVMPPSNRHPYVFAGLPNDGPRDINSTATRLQVASGTAPGATANVADGRDGLFSIPIFVPANAAPGIYVFTVDLTTTQFSSANPTPIVATAGTSGVLFVPEPSAAAVLTLPALALLRRRARPASRP